MPVRFTHNVLVPCWILTFGLASLCAPVHSVNASLSLLLLGVLVIPVLVLIPVSGSPFWPAAALDVTEETERDPLGPRRSAPPSSRSLNTRALANHAMGRRYQLIASAIVVGVIACLFLS